MLGQESTLEERREALLNIINIYEGHLNELRKAYEEIYGKGLVFDEARATEMIRLFEALKLFGNWSAGDNIFQNSHGVVEGNKLYKSEIGAFDVRQLGCMVECIRSSDIIPSLKNYFEKGQSWEESGLEELCGYKLRADYNYKKGLGKISIDLENDAESIFLRNYIEGFYNTHEGQNEFAEFVGAYDSFYGMLAWEEEKYPGVHNYFLSSETKEISEEDQKRYEEWYKQLGGKDLEFNRDNGYYIIDELANYYGVTTPGGYTTNVGDLNNSELELKDLTRKIIKTYVKQNDIIGDTVEAMTGYDDLTNEYGGIFSLEQDIMGLSNTVYNYKQYYKLMPYEEAKNDYLYITKYLGKQYDESYENEYLDNEWLKYLDKSEVALIDYLYHEKDKYEAKKYIDAMTDTVNQRKGMANAVRYAESLNGEYPLDDVVDTLISLNTGLLDGVVNFGEGFVNLVAADGVRDARDYELMYKMMLLSPDNDNKYTSNLSDGEKKWLSQVYSAGSSLGYMAIPTLLSYVPVVGGALSYTTLTLSSTGNNTKDLMQQGVDKSHAYLYGFTMALSETMVEKLIGGLPGGADNAGKGLFGLIKSSLGEAGEEAFQTYLSEGIACIATGEPFDLASVSKEAYEAGLMAIFTSGAMNAGGKVFIKVADTVIETSPNKFETYEEWRANIEADFRKADPDFANMLIGKPETNNVTTLDISKEKLGIDDNLRGLITTIEYDSETGKYKVNLINQKSFEVANLDTINNNTLISYLKPDNKNKNQNTNVSEETNTSNEQEVIVGESQVQGGSLGSLLGALGNFKTMAGTAFDLTMDKLTPVDEFVTKFVDGLKANNAKKQIDKLSGDELVTYMASLDADVLTKTVKDAGVEVTLLEYAWQNGYVDINTTEDGYYYNKFIIPEVAKTNATVAQICIAQNKFDSFSVNVKEFVDSLDANILLSEVSSSEFDEKMTLLEYAWENGYTEENEVFYYNTYIVPEVAKTNVDIAQMCIDRISMIKNEEVWYDYVDDIKELFNAHPDIVISAIEQKPAFILCANTDVKDRNWDILSDVLDDDPYKMKFVEGELLLSHSNLIIEKIQRNPAYLKYVCDDFKVAYPDVVFDIVQKYPHYYDDIGEIAITRIVQAEPKYLELVSDDYKNKHPNLILTAIEKSAETLKHLSFELKYNEKVFSYAFDKYGIDCIQYFNPSCYTPDVIKQIKNNLGISKNIQDARTKEYIEFIQNHSDYEVKILSECLSKNPYLYKNLNLELINSDLIMSIGEKRFEEMVGYDISNDVLQAYQKDKTRFNLFCSMINKLEENSGGNEVYFQNYISTIQTILSSSDTDISNESLNVIGSYIENNPNNSNTEFLLNVLWSYYLEGDNSLLKNDTFNIFDIKDYSDIENLRVMYIKAIESAYANFTSDSHLTKEQKNILLQAYYGISYDTAERIMEVYSESMDNISLDPKVKHILITISEVLNGTNAPHDISSFRNYDVNVYGVSILLEQYLKNAYSDFYMEKTFKVSEHDVVEKRQVNVNDKNGNPVTTDVDIYVLDDDSIAVVHAKDAYGSSEGWLVSTDDYREKYYTASEKYADRHHLSTSVVSNDKGGVANLEAIVYGYENWKIESLVFMGAMDLASYSKYGISVVTDRVDRIKFQSPQSILDNTYSGEIGYNEIVFERAGITPNYMILYDSALESVKQATYQAAFDWGIPIVMINK